MTDLPLSELRSDPIVGRQVFIAEDRAGRPNDFSKPQESSVADASVLTNCPFCAGHETQTPAPLLEVRNAQGDWQVRVVPNKFPAVILDAQRQSTTGLFFASHPALGAQEVIIESPRHVRDATDLSCEEFATVLRVFRDRLRYWAADGRMQHVLVFKNVGDAAGASLEHTHSQVLALPTIPQAMEEKLQATQRFYAEHQQCVYCRLLESEVHEGARLVAEEGPFIAFCAYAGRQPYETWILPKTHTADFSQISDTDAVSLAKLMQGVLRRLHTKLPALSYNLVLYTGPFGKEDTASHFHWHWELIPRTTQLAGLEWGTGLYINPLSPERAASFLRETELAR